MSTQSVPEDGSALSRVDRAIFALERLLALIAGATILAIMLVAVANILGRKLFNIPVPGFIDWMEQSVPIIAFLGIAFCQRLGGHIRMDLLVGRLRGRVLYAAEWFGVLAILVLSLILVWGSWLHFGRSFDFGSPLWSRDSTIDLSLPTWPVKLVVPVMLFLLALRLSLQLWAYGRAFRTDAAVPVAVPLIETPAQQAEREAQTVSGFGDDNDEARDR
ncbi:MAG: TRAP transporter small permease [Rhizobiaceae bacterium]|nr:TRAP transporter small permease [Rhizobiaceae bacterium]